VKRVTVQIENDDFEKISKRAAAHNISVSEYVRSLIEREVESDRFDAITFDLLWKNGQMTRMENDIDRMRKVSVKMMAVLDQMKIDLKDCRTE
jgi:hypothetical protein